MKLSLNLVYWKYQEYLLYQIVHPKRKTSFFDKSSILVALSNKISIPSVLCIKCEHTDDFIFTYVQCISVQI